MNYLYLEKFKYNFFGLRETLHYEFLPKLLCQISKVLASRKAAGHFSFNNVYLDPIRAIVLLPYRAVNVTKQSLFA
jgi:hypothetical protein